MTTRSDFRRQREYWDSNLDPDNLGRERAPGEAANADPFYLTPDQRLALEALGPLRGRRILDLGAGLGTNARHLAGQGAVVIAADIAANRLRLLARSGSEGGQILPVVCRAEALPFRRGAFDGEYTKSVLIHTALTEAAVELARTLAPEGRGVFVEPFTRNPFANLYRATFAPKEWIGLTRYFDESAVNELAGPFGEMKRTAFYFLSFVAFVWQFAIPVPWLFRMSLAVVGLADRALFAVIPAARRLAWFEVMVVSDGKVDERGGGL